MAKYVVNMLSPNGELLETFDTLLNLQYQRGLNQVGSFQLTIPATFDYNRINRDNIIEIWRKSNTGLETLEMTDTAWLIRSIKRDYTSSGTFYTIGGYDGNVILEDRIIPYPADTAYTTQSATNADNAMKVVIRQNYVNPVGIVTLTGTDSDRVLSKLSVDANTSQGYAISLSYAKKGILETLQKMAIASSARGIKIFFDMIWDSYNKNWQFKTFKNYRNIDRRNYGLFFGPTAKNVLSASDIKDYTNEYNAIYVAGQGTGDDRDIAYDSDTSRSLLTPYARREKVIDKKSPDNGTNLDDLATTELYNGKPIISLEAEIDTTIAKYGDDWQFGDIAYLTIADYTDITTFIDFVSVTVDSNQNEKIGAKLRGIVA